jgi:hypothetical protein
MQLDLESAGGIDSSADGDVQKGREEPSSAAC